jgi:hypothetical protein
MALVHASTQTGPGLRCPVPALGTGDPGGTNTIQAAQFAIAGASPPSPSLSELLSPRWISLESPGAHLTQEKCKAQAVQKNINAVLSRVLDAPLELQELVRTESDDELEALVKESQFYASKYPKKDGLIL